MHLRNCLRAGVAATGAAVVGVAAMTASPAASAAQPQSPHTSSDSVQLAAATVPFGGLVTSFVGNQLIYCSLICPLLVETAVAPAVGALQAPGAFLNALTAGDVLKAIGAAAASVTGPTNSAAEEAIFVDGSIPAKRALNALEVGVVGLLNVIPAAEGGLPGVVSAIEAARQDTFIALNLPVVTNPAPTVMPHGVLQVAVVGALNVGGAIIFPAFNHILSATFETPDAIAQELAATGDPLRAVAAGVQTATGELSAAVNDIADSVVTAISDISTASQQSHPANRTVQVPAIRTAEAQNTVKTTTLTQAKHEPPGQVATTKKRATAAADTSHSLRAVASSLRQSVRSAGAGSAHSDAKRSDSKPSDTKRSDSKRSDTKKSADRPHHAASA